MTSDRYVKVVGDARGLRLVYSINYGPAGALALRRRMDADHDGRISASESAAEARRLGARIAKDLALLVDDEARRVAWSAPFVGPASGPIDSSPLTVELEWSTPLGPGEHVVSLVDVAGLEGIDRSDYAFEASPPVELLASGAGAEPSSVERLVSVLERPRPRGADRRFTVRLRLPAAAVPRWLPWAGAALALALAVLIAMRIRARLLSGPRTGTSP